MDYSNKIDYSIDHLKEEYRGFTMERNPAYMLWKITGQPTGKRCPNALAGHWTALELLKNNIDNYLATKELEANAANNSKN